MGKGATFTISLPILDRSSETALQKTADREQHLFSSKVPIVDDNDDSRNLICFVLEAEGAEVSVAPSAMEALSKIEQFKPNILISDIGMPHLNGYESIQKIRQLQPDSIRNVKAIAISGYASEQDRQKSLTAGFEHHLNKPLDINSLIEVIED